MLVENSKDILYLVISFCVLWVTVFLCWMFYYAAKILKNTSQIVEEFRMKLHALTEAVNYIRGKVEGMSDVMAAATSGVGGLVKNVVSRKAKEWMSGKEKEFDYAAKDAVDKAVAGVAKKIKRTAARMKK